MSQGAAEQPNRKSGLIGQGAAIRGGAVGWADVQVRPFAERDIEPLLDYYYRSPRDVPGLQEMDFAKFPVESEQRHRLMALLRNPELLPTVTVEYLGRAIGIHQLHNLRGSEAEFLAHFWASDLRGKGIGTVSWFKACQYFFDIFESLQSLLFKAPKTNPVSRRLAKKLPLKYLRDEELQSSIWKSGIYAEVYAVSRGEFARLHNEDEFEEAE